MSTDDAAAPPSPSPGSSLPPGEYFTPSSVARLYGVDPKTVRGWIDRGLLPCYRLPPTAHARGYARIRRGDLIAFRATFPGIPVLPTDE
jgi:hypothetical protein